MGIKYCVPQTVHMDTTPEKRMKFAEVIIRKCDEVSALTNDLFLHALSDMDKLEMNMHEVKLCALKPMGITHLIISLRPDSVLFPIGLICVSFFLFAFLVSRGIKKLSATVLIAE